MLMAISVKALLCVSADAEIEVDFNTTRGTITAVMEYGKAPKAVANLLSLANGTRSHVDPPTGRVISSAFFEGLSFHEVTNTSAVKTIETGSPSDLGGDDPGFVFPDEFDESLLHEPYVLSMASNGPNTNGSRFCFTGDVSMPSRNRRNTVFGRVVDPASRAVIDAILAAGSGTTEILTLESRRSGANAIAFDDLAQGLPEVWPVSMPLRVNPGETVEWLGIQPPFSVLKAHQSGNLTEWSPCFSRMCGLDDPPSPPSLVIGQADAPSRFYHFSLTAYPEDAGGISGLSNRRLAIKAPGIGTIIYRFNAEGSGGTYENIVFPGEPPFFSGLFTVSDSSPSEFQPHSFRMLLYASGLGGSPYSLIRAGIDNTELSAVHGRHATRFLDESMNTVFEDEGTMILTRP